MPVAHATVGAKKGLSSPPASYRITPVSKREQSRILVLAWNQNRPHISLRGYLILLVISALLPVVIFAGVVFARYYDSELARIEEDLQNDARKLALTIDRDLTGQLLILQTLTTSRRIAERDYEGFYRQATQVKEFSGVNILLRELDGQHLVNTRLAWGTQLPRNPAEGDQEVIASKKPYISGVIVGTVARRPIYTMTAPVIENGRVALFLNLSLEAHDLVDILKENIEPVRTAGIFDRNNVYLARTALFEDFLGKASPPSFTQLAAGGEGIWRGKDGEGRQVRAAYARSKLAGWAIWVSIPEQVIQSSLLNTLWTLAALGAMLMAAALLIAYAVGGRMARSMRALAGEAATLGRGEPIAAHRLPVWEFNEVGHELAAASEKLREREQQLRDLSTTLERRVAERTEELVGEMRRRTATEDTLRQVQKMEAVGHLTGGIAHDFNNMLAIIMGSLDLALRRLERGDSKIEKHLLNAQDGSRRAAALTQRLLAFARQQPLAPEPIDANKLVAGMSDLLRRSLGETIQLETVLGGGLWRINVDGNQLESALLNLAVNARDAMPDGGRLTIETANAHLDDGYSLREGVPAGQYVLIALTDTGVGMAPEIITKAFDPFFTTKRTGAGTGLGLSQVYGFVKQSGGHVKIYSEPGEGTTVKIYLPRLFGAAAVNNKTPELEQSPMPGGDGSITILVVEDEEGVRNHAVEALRELGYNVLEAADGATALRLIDENPDITLLFTDVVMPEMNGRRLGEEAAKRRPSLKILFTTGYTRNAIVHNGMLDHGVNLLSKPFTLEQLARKLAEALKS
jgi:signal transduction histidine kinase/CheY-like chemotaxis protein